MVSEEVRDRLDHLPHTILSLAARRLNPDQRAAVYEDEWLPELTYILKGDEARPITRLYHGIRFAFGILVAVRSITRQLGRPSPQSAPAVISSAHVPPKSTTIENFFETFYPRLIRFLAVQCNDSFLVEYVADDAIMAAWVYWDRLIAFERPDSWLFKVALRKLRRAEVKVRESSRHRQVNMIDEEQETSAVSNDRWVKDHAVLLTALRGLPRRQTEVISLHSLLDYSLGETAEILDVTEGSVKFHLNEGLKLLRQILPTGGNE